MRGKTARKALWAVDLAQRSRLLEERNAKARRRKDAKVEDLAQRSKRCQAISHARWWVARQRPLCCLAYGKPPSRLAPLTPAPGFSPEGGTSLPVCVSHRILARTQPFYILSMRKHLYQILRNSISILFEKHMLGLQCYHSPQCAAFRDSSLSPSS